MNVRRFSPEEDELYFDLRKDPKEQSNVIDANRERKLWTPFDDRAQVLETMADAFALARGVLQ